MSCSEIIGRFCFFVLLPEAEVGQKDEQGKRTDWYTVVSKEHVFWCLC